MGSKNTQNHSSKQNLPTLKCECGHEILFLPDSKEMGRAIEKHALEHKKKCTLTEEETNAIIEALITQAFRLTLDLQRNKDS